jgi:hypothetical protein
MHNHFTFMTALRCDMTSYFEWNSSPRRHRDDASCDALLS